MNNADIHVGERKECRMALAKNNIWQEKNNFKTKIKNSPLGDRGYEIRTHTTRSLRS